MILPSKQHRTARIHHACRIHPPCVDGPAAAAELVVLDPVRQSDRIFCESPTILAWDLAALCRILPLEARSP